MWGTRSNRERLGLVPRRRRVEHETAKEPHYVAVEVLPGDEDSPVKTITSDIPIIDSSCFLLDGLKDKLVRKNKEETLFVKKFKRETDDDGNPVQMEDDYMEKEASPIPEGKSVEEENLFSTSAEALGGLSSALFCPVTVQWLLENYETKVGVSLPRSTVYNHYIRHCKSHDMEPVNAASFGKLIRSIFLGLQTRRLGTRGNSKYHYYGIQIKPDSVLNDVQERDSASQSDSEREDQDISREAGCNNVEIQEVDPLDVTGMTQNEKENSAEDLADQESAEVPDMEELAQHLYVNCRIEPESYLKFAVPVATYQEMKNLKDWQKDIRLITKFTCDPQRKDLTRKIQQECSKFGKSLPKIDHRLSSENITRHEVDTFRHSYRSLCELLIKSCVLYKLDSIVRHCHKYWSGLPLLKRTLSFSMNKLKLFSKTENMRQFIQTVDTQIYQLIVDLLFPNILHPIPVVVIDVVRNFAQKFMISVPITMEDYPEELRKIRCIAAEAFGETILYYCKLNMLAEAVRPLFEEQHRTRAYKRLKELNVPAALSVSIYSIANEDKYFYLIETYRQALSKMQDLDSYAEWVKNEVEKTLGGFKSLKEEPKFDEQAKAFAKDMSYILYVICSQMAFMDTEVNTFFAELQLFTNNYVLHLIEEKRMMLRNMTTVQFLIHCLTISRG